MASYPIPSRSNALGHRYAGPPGKDEDGEEGLVHFACARKNGPTTHRKERFGAIGRQGVRLASLAVALEMIEEAMIEEALND